MEKFARIVVGYHGCHTSFADDILLRRVPISEWNRSRNQFDWLGEGIYFWEHSPKRALRWAQDKFNEDAAVLGAVIQLGACFDLLDEDMAALLGESYTAFKASFEAAGTPLPVNRGKEKKLRDLDCAVINDCIDQLAAQGLIYDTVRGAFLEGEPVFEGTTISSETHIQIAVRNADCILGAFMPNL